MSWFIGFCGEKEKNKLDKAKLPESQIFESEDFFIAVGSKGFLSSSFFEKNDIVYAVAGVGIDLKNKKFLNKEDWGKYLTVKSIDKPDGHFCGIIKYKEEVRLFTDVTGLRDILIFQNDDGIYFSTRTYFLTKVLPIEINFHEFGSRWLLINQISGESIFKNITRLCKGDSLTILGAQCKLEKNNWMPVKVNPDYADRFEEKLTSLIYLGLENNYNLSLGLSGGFDSRLILSYLIKSDFTNWGTHTFGDPKSPDSIISGIIAKDLKLRHTHYFSNLLNSSELVSKIQRYVLQTGVVGPASSILNLQYYDHIDKENTIIIDGGFGEIYRREFAYRLLFNTKDAIYNIEIEKIANNLRLNRADIFNNDVKLIMEDGAKAQIQNIIGQLPPASEIGIENWLDIFSIKTRMCNFEGPEQSRVDGLVLSYMPFAQRSLLEMFSAIPLKDRINGKFLRSLLKKNSPRLTKYSLVKGDVICPYFLSSMQSRVYAKVKTKLGLNYKNEIRNEFLNSLKEYIFDTIQSASFKNCEYYNHKNVRDIVNEFYDGNKLLASQVDWWLAFEIFRQSLNG
jgi:hypothetical protein